MYLEKLRAEILALDSLKLGGVGGQILNNFKYPYYR